MVRFAHLLTINKLMSIREVYNMVADQESLSSEDTHLMCNGKPLPCNSSLVLGRDLDVVRELVHDLSRIAVGLEGLVGDAGGGSQDLVTNEFLLLVGDALLRLDDTLDLRGEAAHESNEVLELGD